MALQDIIKEAKKLSVIFTLAAAATTGGVIGGGVLYHEYHDPSVSITETTRFTAPANNNTVTEAEVIKVNTDGSTVVRAHTWVGQYIMANVTPEGTPGAAAASTTARFTDEKGAALSSVSEGQTVYLRNISGKGLQGVAIDLPNVKPSGDVVKGPIQVTAVKVIDGDTPAVMAEIWPGYFVSISVRQYGIDTPEKGGRAKNEYEAELAEKASATARALIEGKQVLISNIEIDKFGGRVIADVKTLDGVDLGDTLVKAGLARPYFGEKKEPWVAPKGWTPEKDILGGKKPHHTKSR